MANDLNTILNQVDLIFKHIEKNSSVAQELLGDANRLSTVLYNVAEIWIEARKQADLSKAKYDDTFDTKYIEYKKQKDAETGKPYSDELCKALARMDCREMYLVWLDEENLSRRLYALRTDIDRKVSVLQSYASELRSQYAYRKGGDAIA